MAFKRSFTVLFLVAASVAAIPHEDHSSYHGGSSIPSKGFSEGGKNRCNPNEFWYKPKSCCLPQGGPSKHPEPPASKGCPPHKWYWHTDNACCVPTSPLEPSAPPPQCAQGWHWIPQTQCCERHATPPKTSKPSAIPKPPSYPGHNKYNPSAKGGHRHKKRSAAPRCPPALEACPVGGLTGFQYECLDTSVELQSCGGCASTGEGWDCTAIKGAWNVGCEAGSCAVYTCALGYKVAKDGKSCVED